MKSGSRTSGRGKAKRAMRSKETAITLRFLARGGRLVLIVGLLVAITQAQAIERDEVRRESLAAGIEHLEIIRGGQDCQVIHALVIDPKKARITLARAMDEMVGAETTSSLAARHGAIAAINGGYFRTTGTYRGESIGMLVIGNKVLSEPVNRRAALAVSHSGGMIRAAVASVELKAELQINRRFNYPISGFNRLRESGELILFTPEFHRTTLTNPDGIEVVIAGNRVMSVEDGKGSQPIPRNGFVLSGSGSTREWLLANVKRGARVEIKTELITDPVIPFAADFIVGGGPRLLAANKPVASAEATRYSESLIRQRHPRTALGWRQDGMVLLLTVDGRQPGRSVGMTIDELTALLSELGCIEAINLDGGGSTTMVIRHRIVNKPSDATGERPVSDALLLFPAR